MSGLTTREAQERLAQGLDLGVAGGQLNKEAHPSGQLGSVERIGLLKRLLRLFGLAVSHQRDRQVEQRAGLQVVTLPDPECEGCGGGQRGRLGVGAGKLGEQVREPVGVCEPVEGGHPPGPPTPA